jgi:hypothetical protein
MNSRVDLSYSGGPRRIRTRLRRRDIALSSSLVLVRRASKISADIRSATELVIVTKS